MSMRPAQLSPEESDQENPESLSLSFQRGLVAEPLHHVPALDGLRALAVLAVLFYHAKFGWIPGGFLGVSTFFTLSGFLITSLILREWVGSRNLDLRRFWRRRFRRLLPAAWTTIAAVLLLGAFGVWNGDQLRALRGDVPFALFEIINWHFIAQQRSYGAGFVSPSPLEHFWSLAIEEQFYILLPLIVLGLLRASSGRAPRRRVSLVAWTLGGLIVLSAALNGLHAATSVDRSYFGTDTRMAEMLLGSLLACFTLRRLRMPTALARQAATVAGSAGFAVTAILWHTATVQSAWIYPWGLLLCGVSSAAIILSALQGGAISSFLAIRPFLWLGKISYGVYLLHWPIFLWLSPARVGWSQWPLFGLRVGLTLLVATVMFHVVEDPIRRGRALDGKRFAITGIVVFAMLLGSVSFLTRNPPVKSAIQRASDPGAPSTTIPPPTVRVLIVGDQSATELGAALTATKGLEVSTSGVDNCGLTLGGWVSLSDGTYEHDVRRCGDATTTWTGAIEATQPDLVLVMPTSRDTATRRLDANMPWLSAESPDLADFLHSEIARTLDTLSEAAAKSGAEVVTLSAPHIRESSSPPPLDPRVPNPAPNKEVLISLEESAIGADAPGAGFAENDNTRVDAVNSVVKEVSSERGLRFLDLASLTNYLAGGGPIETVRPSGVSFSPSAGEQIGEWLVQQLRDDSPTPPPPAPIAGTDASFEIPPAPPPRPRRHVAPGAKPSILVVGDSVGYSVGFGMDKWAQRTRSATVNTGAEFGCPIARGGRYRFQRDLNRFEDSCDWAERFPKLINGFRPDVVLLSSGIWEVVDRQLNGDDRYRHIGDPKIDSLILAEFVAAIDVLGADGATVAVASQPHMNSGLDQGFQNLPESEPARIDRLNELLRQAAELRPDVAKFVDFQGWLSTQPGGELDPERRPDGIHFSDAAAVDVGGWLGEQLVVIARAQ